MPATERLVLIICLSAMLAACGGSSTQEQTTGSIESIEPGLNFTNFESGQVRPLALASDNSNLYATNTPASTLEILSISDNGLNRKAQVSVGLEPVAVALRNDTEAWVVNHLSDSISVVDIEATPPRVIKTLLVGDEPRDIVFAGERGNLAFITTAHRGRNGADDNPVDAQLFTAGADRADVWVFDAENTGETLGGDPLTVVTLFGDTPRALTTSADGKLVYAAVMHSGNKTTAIGENRLIKAGPTTSADGKEQPDTGLIVQFDGNNWIDESGTTADQAGTSYNSMVPFSLPDYDVFTISTTDNPQVIDQVAGVGTTLFNMATNPVNNHIYVSNTEALNVNRFEGMGHSSSTVRGNFVRNRITIIDNANTNVITRDLNKHIDYTQSSTTPALRALSVAQPLGMAVTADGNTLYVSAFGSQKIVEYDTGELASGSYSVEASRQIALNAGGPTGIVHDSTHNRLYALTRFNNAVAIIDTQTRAQVSSTALFNPEPQVVKQGREFLYNATDNSSHGDSSCASCHVFGDVDALAWDLGNPEANVVDNPNPFVDNLGPDSQAVFHPLKGPMGTQSLRGMAKAGPMHWRGDRTGQTAIEGESFELAAFRDFNIAFPELLGRDSPLTNEDINAFAKFSLTLTYPPNPIRALDNSLNESQSRGFDIYMNRPTTGIIFTCNTCHTVDPVNDHFGTSGQSSVEGPDISQEFKVPHLRNMYQKVGKFGNNGIFSPTNTTFGPQVRGFGFMHDGNMDTLDNFLQGSVFRFSRDAATNDRMRTDVVNFVMAMDSNLAPVVGQQITLNAESGADSKQRAQLLLQRALITEPRAECDLIAKAVINNEQRGFMLISDALFQSDRRTQSLSYEELTSSAFTDQGSLTLTCVPPGSGKWMGIDRNENGVYDGDE